MLFIYMGLAIFEKIAISRYDREQILSDEIFEGFLIRNPDISKRIAGTRHCEIVTSSYLYQVTICAEGFFSSPTCAPSDFRIRYVGPKPLLTPSFGAAGDRMSIYGKNVWQIRDGNFICIDYRKELFK